MHEKPVVSGLLLALALTFSVQGQELETDRIVEVEGHQLRARMAGKEAPMVVFDAGMGDSLEAWGDIPARVAEFASVVIYDRAGIGKSELGPEPRDSLTVARDLHRLLAGLEAPSPYVLVGHSLGGLHIRAFAELFADDVGALVFIDPTTEGMFESLKTEEGRAEVMRQLEGDTEGVRAEARGTPASLEQVEAMGAPPDVPAVVITAMAPVSIPEEYRAEAEAAGMTEERLQALQQRKFQHHSHLAAQMPQSEHLIAEESHHYIHHDEPDLVIDEIRRLVVRISAED